MPRRGCYQNATTTRITAWAALEVIYISDPERISLPPTEHDRRELPGAGCLWTLTLVGNPQELAGTAVVAQSWQTIEDLEPGFSRIPLHEVGRLPGDRPAPFREALGKAQWRWAETRKLLEFMTGRLVTEVTSSRDEQQKLATAAKCHVVDHDGVLCRVGIPGTTFPLPVVPDCRVGSELPEYLRSAIPGHDRSWRDLFLAHAHHALPSGHANKEEMTLTLCTLVYWDNLVRDIVRWIDSCRTCQSRSKKGRLSAVLKSISQVRPHATLIIDLTFVTPEGCHGEVGAISAICATRSSPSSSLGSSAGSSSSCSSARSSTRSSSPTARCSPTSSSTPSPAAPTAPARG